ncbi:hypothetical protein DNTS_025174 [Danionella cerebrum]|uniref:Uncharacterized protein n=1 Tax=Danionella cerebrum TaxID=2873325 RepID=A0A553QCB7_9TELE|nr:hypothetical protein DNTS_025174 [Danionella translucida]
MLQPLVRREVPERRQERGPLQRTLRQIPHLRSESHQGEGHPSRRSGVHGPKQRERRQLRTTVNLAVTDIKELIRCGVHVLHPRPSDGHKDKGIMKTFETKSANLVVYY